MGEIEQIHKKRERRGKIEKILLASLATAGLMSVALLAPNALAVLAQLDGKKIRHKKPEYVVKSAINRLLEKGLISYVKTDRGTFIRLTSAGILVLSKIKEGRVMFKKPKRWDKKWRIVIFDLPEKKRSLRTKLRKTLLSVGFYKLQNSVWVFPYDCEDLLVLLKADFKVGKDILYIIADQIEYDKPLRKVFNLLN